MIIKHFYYKTNTENSKKKVWCFLISIPRHISRYPSSHTRPRSIIQGGGITFHSFLLSRIIYICLFVCSCCDCRFRFLFMWSWDALAFMYWGSVWGRFSLWWWCTTYGGEVGIWVRDKYLLLQYCFTVNVQWS